jgi:hypothetical protein
VASDETVLAIALLVAGGMGILGVWNGYLTWTMFRSRRRQAEEQAAQRAAEAKMFIEDIFLLHRSGILLKHYTRRLRPNIDSDLLSGMLVAVQEFIKDTFREEKGELNEIKFGEMRVLIAEGKWTIIAGVVRGERVTDILPAMRAALEDLEAKYEDPLLHWTGDMDSMPGANVIMESLIAGAYNNGKRQVPDKPRRIPVPASKS